MAVKFVSKNRIKVFSLKHGFDGFSGLERAIYLETTYQS